MSIDLAPGQVWKYETRDGEDDSRLTVVRIDDDPEYGNIVHIYISGVKIPNKSAPDGLTTFVCHMPFIEDSIKQSVSELDKSVDELPEYEDGYLLWRKAFEDSEAGVFEVSVSDGIEIMQQSLAGES